MSTFPTPLPPAQASPGDPPVAAADGLVATDVVKTYGPLGLDEVAPLGGVALTVAPGESVAIMGPSGSGKTTLLHVLAGILTATAGSVTWRGRDLARMSDRQRSALRRQDFGFVFKAGHLLPELQAVHGVLAGADQVPEQPEDGEEDGEGQPQAAARVPPCRRRRSPSATARARRPGRPRPRRRCGPTGASRGPRRCRGRTGGRCRRAAAGWSPRAAAGRPQPSTRTRPPAGDDGPPAARSGASRTGGRPSPRRHR